MIKINPVILKNEFITVELSSVGARINGVYSSDGKMILVDGDTVLFPVCAGEKDNKITIGQNEYNLEKCGFVKNKEFTVMENFEDYAEFILTSDEETVVNYPFSFNLIVSYKLLGKALEVRCVVGNFSEYKMPYSLGFNVHVPMRGAKLAFECEEVLNMHKIESGVLTGETVVYENGNGKEFSLKSNGDFVLKNIISDKFDIACGKSSIGVGADDKCDIFASYNGRVADVGIWSGEDADICIAPFSNVLDENSSAEYYRLLTF